MSYQQSQANAAQADDLAARQSKLQIEASNERIEQGDEESDRRRRAAALEQGKQRAQMAANGLDVTQGDPLDVLNETKSFGEEDAFAIRENARRDARDLRQGAANAITKGRIDAANHRAEGFRTILGTAAQVGSKYKHWAAEKYGGQFA